MLFVAAALRTAVRTAGMATAVICSCLTAFAACFYMLLVAAALRTAVGTAGIAATVICSCFTAFAACFYMLFMATASLAVTIGFILCTHNFYTFS